MNLIIGSHVSFKSDKQLLGSVNEALSYGENTFMFYTGAPQNTIRSNINDNLTNKALEVMKENNINIDNVIVHAPYIVNLAKEDNDFAISFLKQEIKRCSMLHIKYMVLHPGSSVSITKEEGINNIINALNIILDNEYDVTICLETMAGKGNEVGSNLLEIKNIINKIEYQNKIGVCLDTCHLNDAGYDISNFDSILDEIDKLIGIDKIKCIHINDSKNILGSKKDRHENIGLGSIGFNNLINVIYNKRISNIPKILETPYVTIDNNSKDKIYPPYKQEIDMIKNKSFDNNLLDKIRKYYSK
ncbi:probable endonuclease 4 [Clostridium sp. CAG:762]|nr:probable endonuclease 4 [Clostridium sp. CAG:762]